MAEIIKREKGYTIRVFAGEGIDGKRHRINEFYIPKAKTEKAQLKEVQEYARNLERRVKDGDYYSGDGMTLNEFYTLWKNEYADKSLTQAVIEQYQRMMENRFLPELGYMKINKISVFQIQELVTKMERKEKLHPATIKKYVTTLSSIMNKAYKLGIIKENPCKRLELPKINRDPSVYNTFSETQAKAFLGALDGEYTINHSKHQRTLKQSGKGYDVPSYTTTLTIGKMWKAYFYVALFSGCRRGEECALLWSDLDFKSCTVSITKATSLTKSGQIIKDPKTKAGVRKIRLPAIVFEVLNEWKTEQMETARSLGTQWKGHGLDQFNSNYVFTQNEGQQVHLSSPTHKLVEIINMYNATVTDENDKLPMLKLHDLRHCSASLLIANGVDVATVSARLGHSKTSITLDRYTHAIKRIDDIASEKLGQILSMDNDVERHAEYTA